MEEVPLTNAETAEALRRCGMAEKNVWRVCMCVCVCAHGERVKSGCGAVEKEKPEVFLVFFWGVLGGCVTP